MAHWVESGTACPNCGNTTWDVNDHDDVDVVITYTCDECGYVEVSK